MEAFNCSKARLELTLSESQDLAIRAVMPGMDPKKKLCSKLILSVLRLWALFSREVQGAYVKTELDGTR